MSNRSELSASRDLGANLGSSTATAIDQMIRWPFWAAGATMDLMLQGMERMTGQTDWAMGTNGQRGGNGASDATVSTSGNGSTWSAGVTSSSQNQTQSASASVSTGDDQDLSGDDLKYVHWSILFCKPGFETVLEPQQDDIVNYSADGPTYAAVKIAKYLEQARNGRADRPQIWAEKGYPTDASNIPRRAEPANIAGGSASPQQERGWRIPADDQKYIKFLYHVERRLPKEEPVVTRVERVTIERGVEPRSAVG
jgi:hypothetical protein